MVESAHGIDWTEEQNDLVVADYFAMRAMQLAGQQFVKLHRYRAMSKLIGKSHKAVEAKHQNISAVLERLGMNLVSGLRPRAKFQNSLMTAIERYLTVQPEVWSPSQDALPVSRVSDIKQNWRGPVRTLLIGPAPETGPQDQHTTIALDRLVRKFDAAARDSRNRKLGFEGEELVFHHERAMLRAAGRDDLARKVEWTSQERGDGAGYDIASFGKDGSERLIEVKTTNGPAKTPFYLSENERQFSTERPDAFRLLRVHDFTARPAGFEVPAPLLTLLALQPTSYRASLR